MDIDNHIKSVKWIPEADSPVGFRKVVICQIKGKERRIEIEDAEEEMIRDIIMQGKFEC